MRLCVSSEVPPNWSSLISAFDGNIYHSAEWARIRSGPHSTPLFFVWRTSDEEVVALSTGIEQRSALPVVGSVLKRLGFETYPAVAGDRTDTLRRCIADIVGFARAGGVMGLEIGSHMAPQAVPEMEEMGLSLHHRTEFVVDLAQTEDERLKSLSSHHARKLRKARKNNLEFREAESLEAMQDFRRLQVMSRDRRLERGEDIGILEDSHYMELGRGYFGAGLGRVFLVTQDEVPISAAFVSIYGGRALYVYGGSSDPGFRMDAPALLFWNVFSRCRELGCSEFSLGGVPAAAAESEHPSHGLYRFKAGFGGRQVPCITGSNDELRPVLSRIRRVASQFRGS